MNKRQLEVEKAKLSAEEQVLARLRRDYRQAAKRVSEQIRLKSREIDILLKDIDELDEVQLSILQSKIYQKHFQESLKQQIDNIIAELNNKNYESINRYLKNSYELGYTGTMYDLAGQGIPLVMPINQLAMVKAVQLSPKVSKRLYGEYVHQLSKHIRNEVSRGIATADSYANIARNISNASKIGFNKSMRIARTEGHRVQCTAAFDAQHKAMDAGADIVKQWDATLDGRTRPLHRELDGQIRELDEPFEAGGLEVMYPSAFGRAAQDINCRCALLQRAKWALDDDELERLKARAEYFGLGKAKDFEAFRTAYLVNLNNIEILHCYGDHLREMLGAALKNNQEEVKTIVSDIKRLGGSIVFLENNTKMVCNIRKDEPGVIEVDENISIGGLRHEYRHFLDDVENGCPGLAYYLKDKDAFFEYELHGYEEELAIARKSGYIEIEKKIVNEIEKRRKEIYGIDS